ncbi:hypothetical protein HEB94_005830 [Actinopolymorpha pittospori]|uniref:Uncharacterized protein n=1 Tax=Actinopolymorpha pittospori TaxID=648752 RepID=A0A927N4V0_9ACTN|nr:hypothetical protein [Actinopolymorpha pittospori]
MATSGDTHLAIDNLNHFLLETAFEVIGAVAPDRRPLRRPGRAGLRKMHAILHGPIL